MTRLAVVLFNLGGPDGPAAVRPFLFNLFNDPAIIGLPQPLRYLLAGLISLRRAPVARAIYDRLGGGSPLRRLTEEQAAALAAALADLGEVRCFVSMRYWHPFSDETAAAVRDWRPDQVVLLPLYPQYSTTTTASSLRDWRRAAAAVGLRTPFRAVCCYPDAAGLAAAQALLICRALAGLEGRPCRVLFSAHGLPKKVVAGGDPYEWAVRRSVEAVLEALRDDGIEAADHVVCYQSRVGPLAWLGPATDAEIARAGADGVAVVVVPIAFVSEHSETLVELDIEYRHLAEQAGVPAYRRVPAVGTEPVFIAGLAELVREAAGWPAGTVAGRGCRRLCPATFGRCAMEAA